MKSRNRVLLLVFLIAVIAIFAALGILWYYTAHMDRSGWVPVSYTHLTLPTKA